MQSTKHMLCQFHGMTNIFKELSMKLYEVSIYDGDLSA